MKRLTTSPAFGRPCGRSVPDAPSVRDAGGRAAVDAFINCWNANRRAGFTLAELTVSLTVLALVGLAAAGLTTAALRARDHAVGTAACARQGRTVAERLRAAVDRAAVVRAPDGTLMPAVFALDPGNRGGDGSGGPRLNGDATRLVVWCGGRDPALFPDRAEVFDRDPRAEELLLFTADPARPWRLVEAWPRGDETAVDLFNGLPAQIDALIDRKPDPLTLADRVRVAVPGGEARGCVRFTVAATPATEAIAAAGGGAGGDADAWAALPWVGGAHGAAGPPADWWGLRAVRVRACVQLTPLDAVTSSPDAVVPATPGDSIPLFGCGVRVYRSGGG